MKLRIAGQWLNLGLAAVLMLAVWALLVFVGSRPALKRLLDFSPQQRSTVDPVTVELLAGLRDQSIAVELHAFFEPGNQTPQDLFQQQRQRILQRLRELTDMMLRQYAFHGGDAVTVRVHDPYGDIAAYREAAQRFGIAQSDVVVVAVQQSGRPPRHRTLSLEADLGVVEIPQNKAQPVQGPIVPVLKDFKGEEALSSALKSLLVTGTPVAYFVNGYSTDLAFRSAIGTGYQQLLQMLDALGFSWRELDLRNGVVPKDAAVVVVLEPRRDFTDADVRTLHAYVQRGGRLFLNYSWAATGDWNVGGGELGRLLGFDLGDRAVFHLVVDPRLGDSVRGLDGDPRVAKLDLRLHPNHPMTLRLARSGQGLQLDAAREVLLPDPAPEGTRREPLLTTGPQGWLAFPDANGFPDVHAPKNDRELRPFVVGAVVEVDGVAAEGQPAVDGAVVIVAGNFCNNVGMPVNGSLAANIFNWLCERRVLLDIRGSAYVARHLQVVPQQLARVRWFLTGAVPLVFLLLGGFVFWRRRDR